MVGLVVAVLLLQLAFIGSYVGAFHDPSPHDVRVVVAGGDSGAAAEVLDGLDGHPVDVAAAASVAAARESVREGRSAAALVARPEGARDTLFLASGAGATEATAVTQLLDAVEQARGRELRTVDLVPPVEGDARGLTGFYLVLGWLVGGYLLAALLGVSRGARPTGRVAAARRLGLMAGYAVASGLGGALLVDRVLGAISGHLLALWGLGTVLVFIGASVTAALQGLLGTAGIGVTVLLFVVLGNPSAGGAYQTDLLPAFWRAIGPWLPNGAGTAAVREVVYFAASDVGPRVAVLAGWALVAVTTTLLVSARRPAEPDPVAETVDRAQAVARAR